VGVEDSADPDPELDTDCVTELPPPDAPTTVSTTVVS
jgi:hypothetical protein